MLYLKVCHNNRASKITQRLSVLLLNTNVLNIYINVLVSVMTKKHKDILQAAMVSTQKEITYDSNSFPTTKKKTKF